MSEQNTNSKNISLFVPVVKFDSEEQTITGVVLQPEITDAHGDVIGADVIRKAAHNFLAKYNKATQLGLQHRYFGKYNFELYQSWVAPADFVIGEALIKEGSWIITVKINEPELWQMVKEGKLTGFSIGGMARKTKVSN